MESNLKAGVGKTKQTFNRNLVPVTDYKLIKIFDF